jgi:hypothetical protein
MSWIDVTEIGDADMKYLDTRTGLIRLMPRPGQPFIVDKHGVAKNDKRNNGTKTNIPDGTGGTSG